MYVNEVTLIGFSTTGRSLIVSSIWFLFSYFICHISYFIFHIPYVIFHVSYFIDIFCDLVITCFCSGTSADQNTNKQSASIRLVQNRREFNTRNNSVNRYPVYIVLFDSLYLHPGYVLAHWFSYSTT